MGWVSCSGRHFRVKSTSNCLTFPHERHRDYTIWHWIDDLRCLLWWTGCVISTVEVSVEQIDPLHLIPSQGSERRCCREPFQHHGAVHRPLPVLQLERTAFTFAAWATSLVSWWSITVCCFTTARKPHLVTVLIRKLIWAHEESQSSGPKAMLGDQIWPYLTVVLGHLGNKAFQLLWWGKYLHYVDSPNWMTVVQSLPSTAAW